MGDCAMDKTVRKLLKKYAGDPLMQRQSVGIEEASIKDFVLEEMRAASTDGDWDACLALLSLARGIADPQRKAEVLNSMLVMPEHRIHQEVTMEIQRLAHHSSVPYIRKILESNFETLAYTCSDDEVLAKWFSHALAKIGTPESISLIREFAASANSGIAHEMRYRLAKVKA